MYIRDAKVDLNLMDLAGIPQTDLNGLEHLPLPGQLCMGSERTALIGKAVDELIASPTLSEVITSRHQQNMAIFPIAREGLKCQVAEAIYDNYGYFCDEILLDAHHVLTPPFRYITARSSWAYSRIKTSIRFQKENITVAFIADSIASGLVMKEVVQRINDRFAYIQHVEVISPLTTIRGLCRLAEAEVCKRAKVRVHIFETLLNALPPDYYYSAHYNIPELHIRPDLDEEYRAWWGKDGAGNVIANTACAGYGWSEVFYSPRKQIQMMNGELTSRHRLTIADIIKRNIRE